MDYDYSELQVFLVEPSKTQQHIISNFLKEVGIVNIICCAKGEEVFEKFVVADPDLVISAMYLPDMTGCDLVNQLRQDDYDMAFMLISSETNLSSLEPIKQAGAVAILPKPFTLEALKIGLSATIEYLYPEHIELEHLDVEDVAVLLVDDSPFALKYISRTLKELGVENITEVNDGQEAIEMLGESFFDLVITDYNMPGVNGLQLTEYIRDESEQKSTPVIMITSEGSSSKLEAIKHVGVSAILNKPFEVSSMRNLIASLLN